jgi:hypothetical protein
LVLRGRRPDVSRRRRALLPNGGEASSLNNDGLTPSNESNLEVSRALPENGAQTNPQNSDNRVSLASGTGRLDAGFWENVFVRFLLLLASQGRYLRLF